MSPTLRLSLYGTLHGYIVDKKLQAILYEEIIALYLKRTLANVPLSFSMAGEKGERSPDFLIETHDKPIILEVKTKKADLRQILKSKIKFRYGILILAEATNYSIVDNVLILPLSWFLLL